MYIYKFAAMQLCFITTNLILFTVLECVKDQRIQFASLGQKKKNLSNVPTHSLFSSLCYTITLDVHTDFMVQLLLFA